MTLKWFQQLTDAILHRSRTVFILHFNIRDLVFDAEDATILSTRPSELKNVADFLAHQLLPLEKASRDWVLRYASSTGFSAEVRVAPSAGSTTNEQPRIERYTDGVGLTGIVAQRTRGDTLQPVFLEAAKKPFPIVNANGTTDDPNKPFTWRSPEAVWPLIDRLLDTQWKSSREGSSQNEPVRFAILIDYLDHLIPAQAHSAVQQNALEYMMRWSYSRTLVDTNTRVIAFTSELEAVHRDLYGKDSRIEAIEIPWPERDERHAFIKYLTQYPDDYPVLAQFDADGLAEFANLTSGLSYAEIRDFAKFSHLAAGRNAQDGAESVNTVRETGVWKDTLRVRRQEMIVRQSGGLLTPRHSKFGLENFAGYDYIKDLLRPRLKALREGNADVSGILFSGPPGTGKSFFASCLARDVGIEMVTMQTIRGSYVGESERNFERVLRVATNMHPVIIFVDEIDQTFTRSRGSGGDGGVEQRLFARLLEFMEDRNNLGKVLWMAASNKPGTLDAALLSRFRMRLPFLLPDSEAILAMLRTQIPGQAGFEWDPATWQTHEASVVSLAHQKLIGKFSGREIDSLVRNAYITARETDRVSEAGVDVSVLLPAIEAANISQNYQQYIRWSLDALSQIDSTAPRMLSSIKEVLPEQIHREIIAVDAHGNEYLSLQHLSTVTDDLSRYL